MDYKTKIKYAEEVADQLQAQKGLDAIRAELAAKGLYENEITKVLFSARNIIGEAYQPKIKEYLLEGKPIHDAEEFKLLNPEIIDSLIKREQQKLAALEKKKVTRLVKEGQSPEKVFQQVDTRFLPQEEAAVQITRLLEVKKQNSGSGRMLNIMGGIGLIVLTVILLVVFSRIFYVLPIIGLVMIVKGITTERMEYDS